MYFVFNKSHMFVRLNLVANLMYIIYVNNTLPLATDLYMKLHTDVGRLCTYPNVSEISTSKPVEFASFRWLPVCLAIKVAIQCEISKVMQTKTFFL